VSPTALRLISWNIAGKVKANPEQLAALQTRSPDLLALQEVRLNALRRTEPLLAAMGLPHVIENVHFASTLERTIYGELLASRWPLRQIDGTDERTPFAERYLAAIIDTPWGDIELHTTHIAPGCINHDNTLAQYEGVYRRLAHHSDIPRILCGDFNTPREETSEGRIITWGERVRKYGAIVLKPDRRRCDAAERCILQGLAPFDLPDVFRALNGYGVEAYSWVHKTKYGVTKRRFDHVFASQSLNPVECRYLTDLVDAGLSDHAAIEALFSPLPTRSST